MPTYAGYTAYQLAACIDSALARELADKGALPRSMPEDEESDSDFSDEEVRTWVGAYVIVLCQSVCLFIVKIWKVLKDPETMAAERFVLRL